MSLIPAKRDGPQQQSETRVLRVDQEGKVEIFRVIIGNSHDQFRQARQTSMVRLEIACKSHTPAMRAELVLVLDEAQERIRALKAEQKMQLAEEENMDMDMDMADEERDALDDAVDAELEANGEAHAGVVPGTMNPKDALIVDDTADEFMASVVEYDPASSPAVPPADCDAQVSEPEDGAQSEQRDGDEEDGHEESGHESGGYEESDHESSGYEKSEVKEAEESEKKDVEDTKKSEKENIEDTKESEIFRLHRNENGRPYTHRM